MWLLREQMERKGDGEMSAEGGRAQIDVALVHGPKIRIYISI